MGRQVFGFGNAHHQHLSILIELLAADKYIEKSEICIFLSPGWFQANGSNSSAFVQFAKPELLNRIITSEVDSSYKKHIGEFIFTNKNAFASLPKEYNYLSDYYLATQRSFWVNLKAKTINKLQNLVDYSYQIDQIEYAINLNYLTEKKWEGNLDETALSTKETFLKTVTNNKLFVNDDYYSNYLIDEKGNERSTVIEKIKIEANQEYNDFRLVVNYLKERNVKASFIILPLNPYYYQNIELLNPLIDSITTHLDNNKIEYYNMFVSTKEVYEPGTLRDVMHLGDYGWMKVNRYLDSLYYGN